MSDTVDRDIDPRLIVPIPRIAPILGLHAEPARKIDIHVRYCKCRIRTELNQFRIGLVLAGMAGFDQPPARPLEQRSFGDRPKLEDQTVAYPGSD
jgi:hypothetical protein